MSLSFLDAAYLILKNTNKSIHYQALMGEILDAGLVSTRGLTPARTLNSILNVECKRPNSRFTSFRSGYFGLKESCGDGIEDAPPTANPPPLAMPPSSGAGAGTATPGSCMVGSGSNGVAMDHHAHHRGGGAHAAGTGSGGGVGASLRDGDSDASSSDVHADATAPMVQGPAHPPRRRKQHVARATASAPALPGAGKSVISEDDSSDFLEQEPAGAGADSGRSGARQSRRSRKPRVAFGTWAVDGGAEGDSDDGPAHPNIVATPQQPARRPPRAFDGKDHTGGPNGVNAASIASAIACDPVEYRMDASDEAWLCQFNARAALFQHLTRPRFELLMDRLERSYSASVDALHHCLDTGGSDKRVTEAVFAYWRQKNGGRADAARRRPTIVPPSPRAVCAPANTPAASPAVWKSQSRSVTGPALLSGLSGLAQPAIGFSYDICISCAGPSSTAANKLVACSGTCGQWCHQVCGNFVGVSMWLCEACEEDSSRLGSPTASAAAVGSTRSPKSTLASLNRTHDEEAQLVPQHVIPPAQERFAAIRDAVQERLATYQTSIDSLTTRLERIEAGPRSQRAKRSADTAFGADSEPAGTGSGSSKVARQGGEDVADQRSEVVRELNTLAVSMESEFAFLFKGSGAKTKPVAAFDHSWAMDGLDSYLLNCKTFM